MSLEELRDFIGLVNRTSPPVTYTRSPRIQEGWSNNWDTTVTMSGRAFAVNEDLLNKFVGIGNVNPLYANGIVKVQKQDVIDTSDVQEYLNGIEVIAD